MIVLAAAALAAAAPQQQVMLYGPEPTPSCGAWTSARANPSNMVSAQYEMWVLGLISGMNLKGPSIQTMGPDSQALLVWIDQYCAAHPLDNLVTGAIQLHAELEHRAH